MVATTMFVLLFVAWVGEWPISVDSSTYYGHWRSILGEFGPLFLPIPGISLSTWQLLVIVLAPFCANAAATRLHARELDRAIVVGILSIIVTFVWGLLRGGSAYFAYYQLWRIMLAFLIGYMLMSLLRTERDLLLLGKMVMCAGLLRATVCIYYYWNYLHGHDDPGREYVTNHEDTLIFVTSIEVAFIWAIIKGGKAAWVRALIVTAVVMYAVLLNDRRIAYVELVLCIPLLYILMGPTPLRRKIVRWALALAPLFLVVVVAGPATPGRALVSTADYQDNSTVAREEENRNLLRTLAESGNPITGTGWGRPYDRVERRYNNYSEDWILAPYTPHNSLLGLAVFSGLIGIAGIWGVMPVAAFLAARGYRQTTGSPVVRAAAMAVIGAISSYSAHCYGDIGLQSFEGAILLGVALGVAGRVGVWTPSTSTVGVPVAREMPKRWVQAPGRVMPAPSVRPNGGKSR